MTPPGPPLPGRPRAPKGEREPELISLIENGGAGSSSGEDGRRTLSVLLGILQSAAAGCTRVTVPIRDR